MSIRSTREVICREKVYENWQKGYELVGEIVRCRDCKHLYKDGECPLRTWFTHTEDDYCSYGERREDGEA